MKAIINQLIFDTETATEVFKIEHFISVSGQLFSTEQLLQGPGGVFFWYAESEGFDSIKSSEAYTAMSGERITYLTDESAYNLAVDHCSIDEIIEFFGFMLKEA